VIWGGSSEAWATTKTFIAGGADNNWSTPASWSPSGVPGSGDTALFNNNVDGNMWGVDIDTDVNVAAITINANFTNSIRALDSTAHVIYVSGAITQAGGTIAGTSAQTFIVGGDLALSGGTLTAPKVLAVGGKFNKTGGTFTQGTNTVLLTSTSDQTHALASQTFYNLAINDGLIGYWRMDETGTLGTISDYSGYGFNLSVNSGTPPTASASHASTLFNNTGSVLFAKSNATYLNRSPLTNPTLRPTSWTLSAWVKVTSLDSSGSDIITGGNSYMLRLTGSPAIVRSIMRYASGSWDSCNSTNTITLNDGAWHHAVAVNAAGTLAVWLDGTETTAGSNCGATGHTQSYTSTSDEFDLGHHPTSSGYSMDGNMDEVRVYNRALSDAEILALYSGTVPGTKTSTQTLDTAITVSNNLTIASGKLATGANNLTVTGSWLNFGGLFSSSSTVTLNATASGKELQTGNQPFNNLTISGSGGGWTSRDRLWVTGTLSQSNGTYDTGGYRTHFGTVNKTAGTFTPNGSVVVIDSTSNQTVTLTDTLNQIRFEPRRQTGLVGNWRFDEQSGLTAFDSSASGTDGTLTNGPYWQNGTYLNGSGTAATIHTSPGDNAGWLAFTGDANVQFSVGNYNPISVSAWFYVNGDGTSSPRILNLPYFRVYVTTTDKVGVYADWGTTDGNWQSSTTFSRNAWHHVLVTYDSGATTNDPSVWLDATALTMVQQGGDPSGTYGSTGTGYIGNSPSLADDFQGFIDDVRIYNATLGQTDATALSAGLNLGRSTTTFTLGGALSLASFRVDDGTADMSSYTMTGTADCLANSGIIKIGSTNFICPSGMTIRNYGTLNMNVAGGTVKIGSGNTLTMDGTLNASTSGVNPTIQNNGSGTYTFTVGSSATATPVLNINGLAVKNTGVNGMNIDSVTGSATTFTRFDGLAFSSSSTTNDAIQLQIKANTLYLASNGCTFDMTGMTSSGGANHYTNVKLTGDGTGTGETRAVFGSTTCKDTSGASATCESYDVDDDADTDGVGDTVATLGAVVQFTYGAFSDMGSGSIAGFPTAAFDWSNFSWWKTYVAYNNISSGVHRLFARNQDGTDAGYYWQIPSGKGAFVGAPRWDVESGEHFVYIVTDLGWVYKIRDYGSSGAGGFKSVDDASPPATVWKYQNGASATATSPLTMDGTNVFWAGLDSGGTNNKFFALARSTGTTSITPLALSGTVTSTPMLVTLSGTTYFFSARSDGGISKNSAVLGGLASVSGTSAITGPLAYYSTAGLICGNAAGVVRVRDSALSNVWSYTNANASACSALYYDNYTNRAFYGDAVGKMYAIIRNGATSGGQVVSSNYPYQPSNTTTSSDPITVAPVYVSGVTAYGTSTGKVVFVDAQNGSSQPALMQMYNFNSAVSSIAYEYISANVGNFMIGTADGHMHFIRRDTADATTMRDPTSGTP
jgi:hypothetical protein